MGNIWMLFGFIIGLIMVIIPEPATTATGIMIMAGTALAMGWV